VPLERDDAAERLNRIAELLERLRTETSALHEEMRTGAQNQREFAASARANADKMRERNDARQTRISRPRAAKKPRKKSG
jgi:hypothetical protein